MHTRTRTHKLIHMHTHIYRWMLWPTRTQGPAQCMCTTTTTTTTHTCTLMCHAAMCTNSLWLHTRGLWVSSGPCQVSPGVGMVNRVLQHSGIFMQGWVNGARILAAVSRPQGRLALTVASGRRFQWLSRALQRAGTCARSFQTSCNSSQDLDTRMLILSPSANCSLPPRTLIAAMVLPEHCRLSLLFCLVQPSQVHPGRAYPQPTTLTMVHATCNLCSWPDSHTLVSTQA